MRLPTAHCDQQWRLARPARHRAHELGIPTIVTGLSRGQFFETRLIPHQFESGRFDPGAIDATVLQARRTYHHTRDAVTTLLDEQRIFDRSRLRSAVASWAPACSSCLSANRTCGMRRTNSFGSPLYPRSFQSSSA